MFTLQMVSGFSGGGGTGGDSSESHDTDQLGDGDGDGDGDDTDSPQPVRRRSRTIGGEKGSRPHSDHLINQILIEKFKVSHPQQFNTPIILSQLFSYYLSLV